VARELSVALVNRGLGLVYGGGNVGLMGVIAETVLSAGGTVTGVIPEMMVSQDVSNHEIQDLRIVGSMHERKAMMVELADGFIALPGGLGTFEEILEVTTWAQLGLHTKPCGLINALGFYDRLIQFLECASREKFVARQHLDILIVEKTADALLDRFEDYRPHKLKKSDWAKSLRDRKR
jgi:hypothetical protein